MLFPLAVAAAVTLLIYLYRRVYFHRYLQYAGIPQPPTSLIFGNIFTVNQYTNQLPPDAHVDAAFAAMHKALGRPPVFLVDIRPLFNAGCVLVVAHHDVAEQITKIREGWPHSASKQKEGWKDLVYLIGPRSIVTADGEPWKALRKRFNPGFQPQHLMTLLPLVLDKVSLFVNHIEALAETGETCSLQDIATNLTFDIIGRVVLDFDMDAQLATQSQFMKDFRALIGTYTGPVIDFPSWLTPRKVWRRQRLSDKIRQVLRGLVRERFAEGQLQEKKGSSRSILSMSLKDVDVLTPEVVEETCDQLFTFIFAGHDTTSAVIAWSLYELSRTPHALTAVRRELDELFGLDASPGAVRARLLAPGGEDLLRRMTYTAAVVKEVLRLYPSAATSRMTKPGDGFTVHMPDGQQRNLDGVNMYVVHLLIQRDPDVFGDTADRFVPERWLHDADKIPPGAWRPFERGPRNCIGQELANIELRAVLAMVVRRYDVVKVGIGATALGDDGRPELDEVGQYKVTSPMYTTRQVTAKPVDGMRVKFSFASRSDDVRAVSPTNGDKSESEVDDEDDRAEMIQKTSRQGRLEDQRQSVNFSHADQSDDEDDRARLLIQEAVKAARLKDPRQSVNPIHADQSDKEDDRAKMIREAVKAGQLSARAAALLMPTKATARKTGPD